MDCKASVRVLAVFVVRQLILSAIFAVQPQPAAIPISKLQLNSQLSTICVPEALSNCHM